MRHSNMNIEVDIKEILMIVGDLVKYSNCEHDNYDSCCCYCRARRIINADDENNLTVRGDQNILLSQCRDIINMISLGEYHVEKKSINGVSKLYKTDAGGKKSKFYIYLCGGAEMPIYDSVQNGRPISADSLRDILLKKIKKE